MICPEAYYFANTPARTTITHGCDCCSETFGRWAFFHAKLQSFPIIGLSGSNSRTSPCRTGHNRRSGSSRRSGCDHTRIKRFVHHRLRFSPTVALARSWASILSPAWSAPCCDIRAESNVSSFRCQPSTFHAPPASVLMKNARGTDEMKTQCL
jgi:hypothetical protein